MTKKSSSVYLIAYNAASAVGWAYVLAIAINQIVQEKSLDNVYMKIRSPLNFVQTAALLEVLHILFGIVKSPLVTTVIQVTSRLFLTWGILDFFGPKNEILRTSPAVLSMVIAWSITEIIRYSYYATNLLSNVPYFLVWMRYTFFYFLYPLGAGSEAFLAYLSLFTAPQYIQYIISFILAIYPPGFYIMYTHMITQRKRYIGGVAKTEMKNPSITTKPTPKKARKLA